MAEYYHVTSKALEKNVIFQSREDFITGMNDIAICAAKYAIKIICFCLMSNHFHFVLYGSYSECYAFIQEYKKLCSIRMRNARGEISGLKNVEVRLDLLNTEEYLKAAIAYVLRNPLAARIIMMPYFYEWSSASAYFRGNLPIKGVRINSLGLRQKREMLKSRSAEVPNSYIVDSDGIISPACYVATDVVEKLFPHPSYLMMALAKRVENEMEIQMGASQNMSLCDSELKSQMGELIKEEFGVCSLSQLTKEDRLRLCLLLRRNFNASVKQISRILRISQELVASVL